MAHNDWGSKRPAEDTAGRLLPHAIIAKRLTFLTPNSKKPSKKILYLGILALVVILVVFISKNHIASSVLGEKNLSYSAANNLQNQKDSDSDSLSDYAEINIWHTNPKNPDTDGDGTLDGVEVNEGRDPSKLSSNGASPPYTDYLSAGDSRITTAVQIAVSTDNSASNNLTQSLSKNFFTSYLTAQDQNGKVSEPDKSTLIQNILSGVPSSTPAAQKYTLDSLNIINSPSKDQIKTYANALASVYQKDSDDYLLISNPTYDQSASYYKKLANDLSKIAVPNEIGEIHLSIVNGYNQMYVALSDLNNYQTDPVKGVLDAKLYQNNRNILPTFYLKIAQYLRENAIIFNKDEPGLMWNNI
ncbi:MAG TPA: thrombospondin type 3 repeat-containing protein [Candidatus Paceibacterota bacterium]|nr:thrombospondin type 3 repeat-containing protein [Candidatus Paceibacterota bacterium]